MSQVSYVKSSKYNMYLIYRWRFGNCFCLLRNDCQPRHSEEGSSSCWNVNNKLGTGCIFMNSFNLLLFY